MNKGTDLTRITQNSTLGALPRLELASLPTPLMPAHRLSAAVRGPAIWLKRDDLTGFALGGNKVRKLEFLAADALRQDADTFVTGGGPQSNHVRTTMAVAASLGMRGVAVCYGTPPEQVQGNHLLDVLLGAQVRFTGDPNRSNLDKHIEQEAAGLAREGHKPYVIGRGGASALGCVGYVVAASELIQQLQAEGLAPQSIFLATGSCGTHAGLLLGLKLLQARIQVYGVTVSRPRDECETRIRMLMEETAALLGATVSINTDDIVVDDGYIGGGYGIPTPEAITATRLLARTEAVFLDHVYTAKAMACLLDKVKQGTFEPDGSVVFLHTGGSPAIFARPDIFIGDEM